MLNHALAACESLGTNWEVDLIGYQGSSLPDKILQEPRIHPRYISVSCVNALRSLTRIPKCRFLFFTLYALLRIIYQVIQLLYILWLSQSYDAILIQNPPCMPLLLVCVLTRLLRCGRTKLIIDWHNYGFSIMAVGGRPAALVKIARWYEFWLGRFGDFHLTVSAAMRSDLE
jgi:beta-1,4-mannosyltransferase